MCSCTAGVQPGERPQRRRHSAGCAGSARRTRGRPRAAGRAGRRTTSPRSTGPGSAAPNRPASRRRSSGSDSSVVSMTRSAAALSGAISSRSAASASPTPGQVGQRMAAARLGEAPPQHLVVAVEEQQAGAGRPRGPRPAQRARGRARSRGCGCRCRSPAALGRLVAAQHAAQQVDRQVVDRLVAEVLEDLQAGGAARRPTCRSRRRPRPCTRSVRPARAAAPSGSAPPAGGAAPSSRSSGELDAGDADRAALRQPLARPRRRRARRRGSPEPRSLVAMRKMPLPRSSIKPVAPTARGVEQPRPPLSRTRSSATR